ncbi:2-amino-4-hydroxy-6-hydroxymethyldihydropteridine diphosphokinase [Glaciecola sp. 1036]|uniref:2-amino-4-hydroxy-6- hydroxymethyldihydropteridine diphosphokinase n=1 Tax=Alteromonadaceae TaxID=72275 RepID=UPI003CFCE9EB
MSHKIFISVGSNVNKAENTRKGIAMLSQHFDGIQCSPVYESEAVGFTGESFFNLVVLAYTDLNIAQVVTRLKKIESMCGRTRNSAKFSDRTLDLDLLTFDDVICQSPVVLPREEILYNAFVLKPLADLAPDVHHPLANQSYKMLWSKFNDAKQKLWQIDVSWSELKQ